MKQRATVSRGSLERVPGRTKAYRVRYYVKEPGKKARRVGKTFTGTKGECAMSSARYRERLEAELNRERPGLTVGEYAGEWHSERVIGGVVMESTLERERSTIARIDRLLGDVELVELGAREVERAFAQLRLEGDSDNAIHKFGAKLKQLCGDAMRRGFLERNPCEDVRLVPEPRSHTRRSLTQWQARKLLEDITSAPVDGRIVAMRIGLATGARRGEVLGLTWGDVDLDGLEIRIEKALNATTNSIKKTKTVGSVRVVPIPRTLADFLREWKAQQVALCFAAEQRAAERGGDTFVVGDGVPVCSNGRGGFFTVSNFDRWRRSWCVSVGLGEWTRVSEWTDSRGIVRVRKAGYKGLQFHELRHTVATMLISSGVDVTTVQELGGWASPRVLMELYSHAQRENKRRAVELMDDVIVKGA